MIYAPYCCSCLFVSQNKTTFRTDQFTQVLIHKFIVVACDITGLIHSLSYVYLLYTPKHTCTVKLLVQHDIQQNTY